MNLFPDHKPKLFWISLICIFQLCACQNSPVSRNGLSPEESLATFELADDFQIELIAAEPLVADPVDMEFDEDGNLYVVEMHGYPLDKSGTGNIKLLTDTDGDGIMDKSVLFADNLMFPTGVMRWKKGILVTDPPHVLYLEDSDGDGKADIRQTILSGFAISNPQHNFNNPTLGLDNWIYLGNEPAVTAKVFTREFSDKGNEIHFPGHPDAPRLPENALGRSVRFRPDQLQIEILSSQTQFGQAFDQWGHRFLVSNGNHIFHEVIAAQYLNRNPHLLVSNATETISDHGAAADVYPITTNPEHQLLTDLGVFTAACGISTYNGGLFPEKFNQASFTAEPVGNLVHADILTEKGATFVASRMYEQKEFLASKDPWFRPVNTYVGPDGALYVVDYYRQIIEHPEWMADDVTKSGEIYNGMNQGRIYRITPKGTAPADWFSRLHLGKMSLDELTEQLGHKNMWWRQQAQRLILDKNDVSVVPKLEDMVKAAETPQGRLHALWTLAGFNKVQPEILITALQDQEAGVRENAVLISEQSGGQLPDNVLKALLGLAGDKNPKVQFQLLNTLGSFDSPEVSQVRQQLLFNALEDPWMRIAALSALPQTNQLLFETVLQKYNEKNPAFASLVEQLSAMTGASEDIVPVQSLLTKALSSPERPWRAPVMKGLAQGMRHQKTDFAPLHAQLENVLKLSLNHPGNQVRRAAIDILRITGLPSGTMTEQILKQSEEVVNNPAEETDKRIAALQLLTIKDKAGNLNVYQSLIHPAQPVALQNAAIHAMSQIPDSTVSVFLTAHWKSITPNIREAAIGTFMANDSRIKLLLDAVEKGTIDPSAISWPRQVGLMAQGNEMLRQRARALLSPVGNKQSEVIKEYASALNNHGNAENGMLVYQKNCAICHQLNGKSGVNFGPDLASIKKRRPENILADILDPNISIADGFDIWSVELKSGDIVQGIVSSETPTAITLRQYGGAENVISRQDIQSLEAMGTSIMTAGLDAQITKEEMNDLLTFIRQNPQ